MNPFYSSIFLSAMWKSSNAPVTFSDRICFGCGEKGHYVNKCPQRHPKDQPTYTGIATPQSIQHSKNFHTPVVGSQKVQRSQAAHNTAQTPPEWKYYNYGEKGHYFNGCPNPRIHLPSALIMNTTPTSNEKIAKVCFHFGQHGHFALQCPDRRQGRTPLDKKCYNCEVKRHFAITCSNPRSCPSLPPSTKGAPNHKGCSMSIKVTTSCFNYG
jgi:hypothetical protein